MNRLVASLLCLTTAYASVAIQQAKVGDRVELDLGNTVKIWERTVGQSKEHILLCKPSEKSPLCLGFISKEKESSSTKAKVLPNGHLVIENVQLSDAGLYSSPDLKPTVTKTASGISALPAPVINLQISE